MIQAQRTYLFNSRRLGEEYTVYVRKDKYANGRWALVLMDCSTNTPLIRATVNMPDEEIRENEVIIMHDDRNEGVLKFLIESGLIGMPKRYTKESTVSGRHYPICELLMNE